MALSETRDVATCMTRGPGYMKEVPSPYHRKIPAPPPPSPAFGAKPSPLREDKKPAGRERSQSWGYHPVPSLVMTPPYSPTYTTSTLPQGGVPFMPNLVVNHHHDSGKSAMEHAMQGERNRRMQKEKEETDFGAEKLRAVLREERNRMSRLAAELAQLKSTAAASQRESEVCEEGRINALRRQLDGVYQEKGRIILELEREEEMLTNTLQKKLDKVKKEKALLEQEIEREHTSHAALQNKLDSLQTQMQHHSIEDAIEESEDEGEVDDSILPDLAARA